MYTHKKKKKILLITLFNKSKGKMSNVLFNEVPIYSLMNFFINN